MPYHEEKRIKQSVGDETVCDMFCTRLKDLVSRVQTASISVMRSTQAQTRELAYEWSVA